MVDMLFNKALYIKSRIHNYSVEFKDTIPNAKAFIIDKNVYDIYEKQFKDLKNIILLEASEKVKSWNNIKNIINKFISLNVSRNDTICVIGGGTIQDISSFVSSIYKRGINWIFIPTTLLAMADSCIGSKTSINYKGYKNQLGTFYPPKKIYINTDYISSLSGDDILSGIGEIIKIHLIKGIHPKKIDILIEQRDWKKLIYNSLLYKKKYIEKDEFDLKDRRILNYGHTFGHAIETLTKFSIPHGKAVMYGILLANYISFKLGYLTFEDDFLMSSIILKRLYPPKLNINAKDLTKIIKRDKKVSGDNINLILTKGWGKMFVKSISLKSLENIIKEYYG